MKKYAWQFAVVMILIFAARTSALQEGVHPRPAKVTTAVAWPDLMSSMEKMHLGMAAVESSGNSDADFVRLMLPHHQAALDMAKVQLLYGKDPQMRRLAQEIIEDQQSEMELMQLWLKRRETDSQKTDRFTQSQIRKER